MDRLNLEPPWSASPQTYHHLEVVAAFQVKCKYLKYPPEKPLMTLKAENTSKRLTNKPENQVSLNQLVSCLPFSPLESAGFFLLSRSSSYHKQQTLHCTVKTWVWRNSHQSLGYGFVCHLSNPFVHVVNRLPVGTSDHRTACSTHQVQVLPRCRHRHRPGPFCGGGRVHLSCPAWEPLVTHGHWALGMWPAQLMNWPSNF